MDDLRENSNWVKARAACTLPKIFADLRAAIAADVEERNKLRASGDPFKFLIHDDKNGFSVKKEATARVVTVDFYRDETTIFASGPGKLSLEATIVFNRDGVCKLQVNGEEMDGWQFRMLALQGLFFGA